MITANGRTVIDVEEPVCLKKKQMRRMKQRLRRRERSGKAKPNHLYISTSSIPPATREGRYSTLPDIGLVESWSRVRFLATKWLDLYCHQGSRHSLLRELLVSEQLVELLIKGSGDSLITSNLSLGQWLEKRRAEGGLVSDSDARGCLLAVLDQLEAGLSSLQDASSVEVRSPTPPATLSQSTQTDEVAECAPIPPLGEPAVIPAPAHPTSVQCQVGDVILQLRFSNSNQNSLSDIGTYLQEKLNVLEFLQADGQRAGQGSGQRKSLVASKPAVVSGRDSALSVGDWYEPTSAPEPPSSGFFIGTPNLPPASPPLDIDEAEQVRWETGSGASSRSNRRVHTSSCRVRSSSASSVGSARSRMRTKTKPRGQRFFENLDDTQLENISTLNLSSPQQSTSYFGAWF